MFIGVYRQSSLHSLSSSCPVIMEINSVENFIHACLLVLLAAVILVAAGVLVNGVIIHLTHAASGWLAVETPNTYAHTGGGKLTCCNCIFVPGGGVGCTGGLVEIGRTWRSRDLPCLGLRAPCGLMFLAWHELEG